MNEKRLHTAPEEIWRELQKAVDGLCMLHIRKSHSLIYDIAICTLKLNIAIFPKLFDQCMIIFVLTLSLLFILLFLSIKNILMGVFDRFIQKKVSLKSCRTTEGFNIGVAEAEGEANNSKIALSEVFEDFLDVISQINNEKFIILGRKGSGKSAIGEHICHIASSDANIFAKFIRRTEIDIEHIVQIGISEGERIEQEMLFKWVVLTQELSLIVQNQNINHIKDISNLKKFIERNRGFINIEKREIKEIIHEKGININIEYFKRFYSSLFNRKIAIKEEKAAFYKLIPYLEETISRILVSDPENSYILIFDDLDIGYYKSDKDISTLSELLRISKYYNNELFGRNQLNSKIIVLLRNDIAKHLRFNADTAKIFASYAIELNWYEEMYRTQEDRLKLKQFINKRIACNFEKNGLEYIKDKPWESFVNEQEFASFDNMGNTKSSFKYVIEHTFFRPRDLILFFKDIDRYKFPIPISRSNINNLIGRFANQIMLEIQNELAAVFSEKEISITINVLRAYRDKRTFTYESLRTDLENCGLKDNAYDIIDELFFYSLIGNINHYGDVSFKFREKEGDICKVNPNENLILHYVLKVYFKNN